MMLSRTSRTVARSVTSRRLSTQPKMHKAKDQWQEITKKRKIDEDDTHLVFHPPYNPATIIGLVSAVFILGAGSMQYGFNHQQYKQGFWK